MALEMLFSFVMLIMSAYCLAYVNTTVGSSIYTDPLGSAFWPSFLLILLIVLLSLNMFQIYKKTPVGNRNPDSITKINFGVILRNRLTWGIALMSLYALLLPVTGFLLTSFLMCIAMSCILGERRVRVLVIVSALAVSIIYVIFFKGMSIMLPRGTVPFLREFGLMVESFLRNLGS